MCFCHIIVQKDYLPERTSEREDAQLCQQGYTTLLDRLHAFVSEITASRIDKVLYKNLIKVLPQWHSELRTLLRWSATIHHCIAFFPGVYHIRCHLAHKSVIRWSFKMTSAAEHLPLEYTVSTSLFLLLPGAHWGLYYSLLEILQHSLPVEEHICFMALTLAEWRTIGPYAHLLRAYGGGCFRDARFSFTRHCSFFFFF